MWLGVCDAGVTGVTCGPVGVELKGGSVVIVCCSSVSWLLLNGAGRSAVEVGLKLSEAKLKLSYR